MLTDTELSFLRRLPLFAGMEGEALDRALTLLDARGRSYARGEFLQHTGTPFSRFGLVTEGTVQVYQGDRDGNELMMANVSAGHIFGESLAFLDTPESPVYIRTAGGAHVVWLSLAPLRRPRGEEEVALLARFSAMQSAHTLEMNDRIQILSRLTLREKILAFLATAERRTGATVFTVPFDRAGMAAYLGVNRTALSRELSRMREEGILDFEKSTFKLL